MFSLTSSHTSQPIPDSNLLPSAKGILTSISYSLPLINLLFFPAASLTKEGQRETPENVGWRQDSTSSRTQRSMDLREWSFLTFSWQSWGRCVGGAIPALDLGYLYGLLFPSSSSHNSSRWGKDGLFRPWQSLPHQAQAKPAVCSSYRLMLKESMTCPGLGKLCIYKMLFASCIPVNCPHFDLEETDYWSSSAWKFESSCITFQALKASVLLILEHDILESSPRTDTDRCHTPQGCRELQVNPTWPSVFLPRESAHHPKHRRMCR